MYKISIHPSTHAQLIVEKLNGERRREENRKKESRSLDENFFGSIY